MSREIEFRAWLKDEKKMITNISSIKLEIHCIDYDKNQMFSYERASFDDIELMQYTGIMDTNGVKVFEGDIVYVDGDDIGVIEYKCGCFYVRCDGYEGTFYDNYFGSDVEVIGNIYENKELLNE